MFWRVLQGEQADAVAARRDGVCAESDVHDRTRVVARAELQRDAAGHPARLQDPPHQAPQHEAGETA